MKILQCLAGDSVIALGKFHENQVWIDREIAEKQTLQVVVIINLYSLGYNLNQCPLSTSPPGEYGSVTGVGAL